MSKKYYIKERYNPQLGTYWVACGQMSKATAMSMESTRYGENIMHPFDSEASYQFRLNELKAQKERVQ